MEQKNKPRTVSCLYFIFMLAVDAVITTVRSFQCKRRDVKIQHFISVLLVMMCLLLIKDAVGDGLVVLQYITLKSPALGSR